MKRLIALAMVFSIVVMAGCSSSNTEVEDQAILSGDTNETMTETISCEDAIQKYLDDADQEGKGAEIKAGDMIEVHYIGRLNDSEVFDTSVEAVAKACGTHNPMRNYAEGLVFTVAAGQMIPGFDEGVQGMKVGQTKTIEFGPEKGYGERSEEAVIKMERSAIPNADEFAVGMEVMTAMGQKMVVQEVTDAEIVFDANHELAGKSLIFDVTIVGIKN